MIEGFEQRIPRVLADEEVEVSVADLEMRHFAKGFFDVNSLEIVTDFNTYDIRQNARNEVMLKHVFQRPQSTLPVQNLGELSFLLQKSREAFSYLDMSLKMFKSLD